MQTFCTEGLVISDNITVYFKPVYKLPPPTRNYTFVSFLNVPLETEEKDMNDFVRQYAEFRGVHYPTQEIGDIKFHTGTRVYRCKKIKEHFPKAVHIFGKWTKIMYNGQPARQKKPSDESEQMETE